MKRFFLLLGVCGGACALDDWEVHTAHSFSRPAETEKYWKKSPFVEINGGNAVMLTPSQKTGYIWNLVRSTLLSWEVVLNFRISAAGTEAYPAMGEGMAFWYSNRPGVLGPVYGSVDFWTGLGLFFTVANDAKQSKFLMVSASVNDGTQQHGASTESKDSSNAQARDMVAGSCVRRIDEDDTFSATIRYDENRITVLLKRRHESRGEVCFTAENVELGVDNFFGLSAHGVGKRDQHNILSFTTRAPRVAATKKRLDEVRQKYAQSLNKQHQQQRHGVSVENFRHQALNIIHQIQDSQALMEEEVEGLMNMADFTLRSMLNHTDDVQSMTLLMMELRKSFRVALAKQGKTAGAPQTSSTNSLHDVDMLERGLHKLLHHVDVKLKTMKEKPSFWGWAQFFLLFILAGALTTVGALRYHAAKRWHDRPKRFV